MLMTLLSPADGKVNFKQIEGAILTAGNLIAILDLDDPGAVQSVSEYRGNFPELGPPLVHSSKVDQRYKTAFTAAKNILQGDHSCCTAYQIILPFSSLRSQTTCTRSKSQSSPSMCTPNILIALCFLRRFTFG